MSAPDRRTVRVIHHGGDGYIVQCIQVDCGFYGKGVDPEREAIDHVETHPGHTVSVEQDCAWVEYTDGGVA